MVKHVEIDNVSLLRMIYRGEIKFGGNLRLKIYGRLNCWSGKRMKKENRVFFKDEKEAIQLGFRPCGHCMKTNGRQFATLNSQLSS